MKLNTGLYPAADHIPDYFPSLAVSAGLCSGLSVQSLLSHLRYQRSHCPPISGTGGAPCPFCLYFHKAEPYLLGGWPLCVELCGICVEFALRLLLRVHSDTFYSSLKTVLAMQELGAFLSSNLEETIHKSS